MLILQSIFAVLISTVILGRCSTFQIPLDEQRNYGHKVIDEELSSYIQNQLQDNNVTGMSLGIVLPNGEVEFGAWGNRTEKGDLVTPEVCFGLFILVFFQTYL